MKKSRQEVYEAGITWRVKRRRRELKNGNNQLVTHFLKWPEASGCFLTFLGAPSGVLNVEEQVRRVIVSRVNRMVLFSSVEELVSRVIVSR